MRTVELLFSKSFQKGQTLIEALIALSIAAIVIVAAVNLTTNSLRSSQTSKDQNLATQFAQEGLEIARRDRLSPPTTDTTYCLGEDDQSLSAVTLTGTSCTQSTEANISGGYKRIVVISSIVSTGSCGASTYQARSRVTWSDTRCGSTPFCRAVELRTCLSPSLGY